LDDFENVDPTLFSKRSKGLDSKQDILKPSTFLLTKAVSAPVLSKEPSILSSTQAAAPISTLGSRSYLQPKSPAAKLNVSIARGATPSSAPAGRSPTRGSKRVGLLGSRRRTLGPAPAYSLSPAVPFSLDAALKGTIPSYAPRSSLLASSKSSLTGLHESELKSSWTFDIHEDTPEQEMTNLLQHSTCVLDISSDEESNVKVQRERAEGRDKENVPPADDVSQTSRASLRGAAIAADDMVVEKVRDPLGEMNAADFYSAGCDGSEVVIVPGDEDDAADPIQQVEVLPPAKETFDFEPQVKAEAEIQLDVDKLMGASNDTSSEAALLQPMEGTGDAFELWESGSSKDESEAPASPAQVAAL
jgi:hypothetical protein